MKDKNLGRLHKVDLREAWASEASDFTPWLAQAENLRLLGEAIGIELELESQEKEVGAILLTGKFTILLQLSFPILYFQD